MLEAFVTFYLSFVVNAIVNSIIEGNEDPCDLVVYDAEKCFDSLWNEDCMNDMFDNGCDDDKLTLMYRNK